MKPPEPTIQRLDPLGALSARPLTLVAAIAAVFLSVIGSAVKWQEITHPIAAIASVVLFIAAAFVLARQSHADRAPMTDRAAWLVVGLGALGIVAAAWGSWGQNDAPRDDWGPIDLALLIVALAPYRRALSIALWGIGATALSVVITLLQVPTFAGGLNPLSYSIAAGAPVLALTLGAAVFTAFVVSGLRHWQETAAASTRRESEVLGEVIARSVQQDRVTILNRDVMPFLTEVLERGTVTAEDSDRASRIASSIRQVMVSEVERSWLDDVVDPTRTPSSAVVVLPGRVRDKDRLAQMMNSEQRAALRAFLVHLLDHPHLDPPSLIIGLNADGSTCDFELECRVQLSANDFRKEFAPYLAVLRTVFDDVRVSMNTPELTVRFCYDNA